MHQQSKILGKIFKGWLFYDSVRPPVCPICQLARLASIAPWSNVCEYDIYNPYQNSSYNLHDQIGRGISVTVNI